MSKAPHLVGKKRQKLSDGEKALLLAPKAHLVGKAWWPKLLLVSRVPCLTQSSNYVKVLIVLIWYKASLGKIAYLVFKALADV